MSEGDIVERLRWRAENTSTPNATTPMLCAEAADEITRLRAEVEKLCKSRNRWGQKYNKLLGKHKTTRTEVANQIQWVRDLADNLIAEEAKTSALRAKVEKLEGALEDIADGLGETDLAEVGRYSKHIARAALGDTHE